jgi:hypothetical protein
MGERWTRPPLVPREAPSTRWATWRFRLVALLLLALLVAGAVQAFRVLSGATSQDPGVDAAPAAPPSGSGAAPAPAVLGAGPDLSPPA